MVSSKIPATTSMFWPRLPRISRAFSGVLSKGMSWNLVSGQSSWSWGHRSTSTWAGVMGEVPMRMTWPASSMAFLARVTESLQYWMMYLASWYRDWPALVSCSPPVGAQEEAQVQVPLQEVDLLDHRRGGDVELLREPC